MKKVTLTHLKNLDEEKLSDYIEETILSKTQHDFYLDKLTTGQYMVSYGEYPLGVFDTLLQARAAYFAKLDHI